jgi:hypothetical protein
VANEGIMEESKIFLVSYVQIQIDNPNKYDHPDIYFAGIVKSKEEAESLAKSCSVNLKNGTIIPKILSFDDMMYLTDMMYEAADMFQVVLNQMKEMHQRMQNTKKKKK